VIVPPPADGKDAAMNRTKIRYTDHYETVMDTMTSRGLLLGSYDSAGRANVMTIGWGTLGSLWGVPIWTVLVGPGRYAHECIEHTGCFSINVPGHDLALACAQCGTADGRETDKFALADMTVKKGAYVLAPTIAECPIVYECQVVHHHGLLPERLAHDVIGGTYIDGGNHTMYFGKILGAEAVENAAQLLADHRTLMDDIVGGVAPPVAV